LATDPGRIEKWILAVVVHGDDPHDGLRLEVASEQHRARPSRFGCSGIGQCRPPEAVFVLTIEVGKKFEIVHERRLG
jgi:hypothetical protein